MRVMKKFLYLQSFLLVLPQTRHSLSSVSTALVMLTALTLLSLNSLLPKLPRPPATSVFTLMVLAASLLAVPKFYTNFIF
jgi:hypothetical protein